MNLIMKTLGKQFIGSFLFILLCGTLSIVSAQTEKQIDAIKQIYKETNEKIAECEENGEYSSTFLSELIVNKNNGQYPAVGIFNSKFKFYYTYGDREKNPYPSRLLKIVMETRRSANIEKYEFLFNETGQLIFYFEAKNEEEIRVYYSAEKMIGVLKIKFLKGNQILKSNDKSAYQTAKNALAEKRKLVGMFQNSLRY